MQICFAGNKFDLSSSALVPTQRNVCVYPAPLDAQQISWGMTDQTRALHSAGVRKTNKLYR